MHPSSKIHFQEAASRGQGGETACFITATVWPSSVQTCSCVALLGEEEAGDRGTEHDCTIRSPLSPARLEGETAVLFSGWGRLSHK